MKKYNSFLKLHKHLVSTLLNIGGLMIAYIAFIIIMMQVNFDNEYDKCHKDYQRIYRLEIVNVKNEQTQTFSRPLYSYISNAIKQNVTHIVATLGWKDKEIFGANNNYARFKFCNIEQQYIDLFYFKVIKGDRNAIQNGKVLIPESMAMRYWGTTDIIGDSLISQDNNAIIGGVYTDFPANSSVKNIIYSKLALDIDYENSWGVSNYSIYIKTNESNNIKEILYSLNKEIKTLNTYQFNKANLTKEFKLISINDIHFKEDYRDYDETKTTHEAVYLITLISFIIIIIAAFNFTNFSIAMIPMRVKSVNLKRIHGVNIWKLRLQLLSEPLLISLCAWCLAMFGMIMCKGTFIGSLIQPEISISGNMNVIILSCAIAVAVGVISGLYSTVHLTTMPTRFALKTHFCISKRGRALRNILLFVQYLASFILIICSVFMFMQSQFMISADLGYDKDNIIISYIKDQNNKERLYEELKKIEGVHNVSLSSEFISNNDVYSQWGIEHFNFNCIKATPEYLSTLGIEIIEGRDFLPTDTVAYIFNETAQKTDKMVKVGSIMGRGYMKGEIVGICKDIQFTSLRKNIQPMAFNVSYNTFNSINIRIDEKCDTALMKSQINKVLNKIEPNFPHEVRMFTEALDVTYANEFRETKQIAMFSIIAILLSLIGILGMLILESEYRRKEIAIRKTLGASRSDILLQFNWYYFRILLISFLVSTIVATFFINQWLNSFAYKVPQNCWVYILVFVSITLITIACISFQILRSTKETIVENVNRE